jgi:dipeptidyl aminopeptidase/acylaminoacyl peptidase
LTENSLVAPQGGVNVIKSSISAGALQRRRAGLPGGLELPRPTIRAVLALAMLAFTAPAYAAEPPLIDVKLFFKNPEQAGHQLSPNGEYLAYLAPWNSRLNVWVKKIGEDKAERITSDTARDIRDFTWTTDDRIVYAQDTAGDENFKLFSVKRDGTGVIALTPWDGVRADLVDVPYDDRRHIIIQHNKRDKQNFDAFRVDVETGKAELLVENPGNVESYIADHHGVIRLATQSDGVNTKLLYRATANEPFKTVIETNFRESVSPQFFTFDDKHLIATSNIGRDKAALVEIDPATGKEVKTLYENPDVDVSGALASEARKAITGAVFVTDKRHYVFFDKAREALQQGLEAKLPDVEVDVAGTDRKEDRWLVRTTSDRSRGDYYIYENKGDQLTHLATTAPWLKPDELAPMRPITVTARDGLTIHGYLTVPVGVESRNLPMIVNPHGGPWARDGWRFNPEVQFLANRGYAVLQLNFRGSTGYGRKFWEASFGQWGRAMQDDITDGVGAMINQGIADPKRVGIYGGSYGGYATLAGVAFTPDLYAAAVDYVGVANMLTFMKTIPPYWEAERKQMEEMVGYSDDEAGIARMKASSPLYSADKIKTPLLIAQGAHDPRVNKAESDQMVAALRARGVDVPYMVKDNEGHGFHNEENRFAFYRAMEQFFGKYLGGRVGPGEDVLGELKG